MEGIGQVTIVGQEFLHATNSERTDLQQSSTTPQRNVKHPGQASYKKRSGRPARAGHPAPPFEDRCGGSAILDFLTDSTVLHTYFDAGLSAARLETDVNFVGPGLPNVGAVAVGSVGAHEQHSVARDRHHHAASR